MKLHTLAFKENIKNFGRELDSIISYTLNGVTIELGGESLNSVTPHYQGAILKSVMKQLDIDSNVNIPVGTQLNYQFGIKIENDYEYLDFGNYIVYSSEKQEDTNSYKIICYDKMLYSMKDYVNIGVTYPITIRNYINAICNYLGITFANSNDTFANYGRQINTELYLDSGGNSLGYTFRDVLDEIAQATASTICINNNDNLEIRYINNTGDTIDEEYLKDINVNFGEKYGPINTIVLSRSAGTDKVYLSHPADLPDEEKNAIEINDNQIMNFNDRADYLPDILNKLNGLEYYLNDYSSTGICYFDLCDRYNVSIGENNYSCVMFNDEVNVTQGLEEKIYTDLPEETETDYTKADKTDRRINQTYLIVDKQNQLIQSLIDKSVYISNTLNGAGSVTLENAYKGRLYELSIKGQMSLLYPQNDNLYGSSPVPREALVPTAELLPSSSVPYQNEVKYPNSDLYSTSMILLIDDTEYSLNIDFLNYINNDVCDEFIYHDGEYKVVRRVGIDSEGNKYALDNEFVDETGYIDLEVDTNSIIRLKSFNNGIYKTTYLLDNQYTDVFATKVELSSSITQTAENINLNVNKKLENYSTTNEMNAAIDVKADEINSVVSTKVGDDEVISRINQSSEQIQINANKISLNGKTINMTSDNVAINSNNFSVDSNGNLSCSNANITGGNIEMISNNSNPKLKLSGTAYGGASCVNNLAADGMKIKTGNSDCIYLWVQKLESGGNSGYAGVLDIANTIDGRYATMDYDGFSTGSGGTPRAYMYSDGEVHATTYTGGSLESIKKNIEKYDENATKIILGSDIYGYNLKTESDNERKHIGLVIGNGKKSYRTPKNIISKNGDGIDLYSMISLSWKAIQEQQEIIENLKERIEKLERESDK